MAVEWDFIGWMRGNFAWVSGSVVALFYGVRWSVRSALKNLHLPLHVTHSELKECQDRVLIKLTDHEREEFTRYDLHQEATKQMIKAYKDEVTQLFKEYRGENLSQHATLDGKLDDIMKIMIEQARAK